MRAGDEKTKRCPQEGGGEEEKLNLLGFYQILANFNKKNMQINLRVYSFS